MAEYEMFQNWHVFVSIFGREIEEKVEGTVKVRIVLPLLIILKINLPMRAKRTYREKAVVTAFGLHGN